MEIDGVTHSAPHEQAADAHRTRILEACGFHVVRVNNIDVYENIEGVLDMIERTLRPR